MPDFPASHRAAVRRTLEERRGGASLSAFAEKIGVSVSFLSEVLRGKKSLSMEAAFKIAVKLNFSETETQHFCLLVQIDQEKDASFREELRRRLHLLDAREKPHDLSADLFRSISEWQHTAILELSCLSGFVLTPASAAARLGIRPTEAQVAIERLQRLELLAPDGKGRLRKVHNYMLAEATVPTKAFRDFHGQLLGKAAAALATQKPGQRISATDVVSLDSRKLAEVDRLSREFSAAVIELSDKSRVKDAVYALSFHAFCLSKEEGRPT